MFKNRGLNVSITAPTGRASKRISEVTGYDAVTIHRLLEVTFDKFENTCFNRNETNPLKCNVLIMDETSMVDTLLFEKVLRAVSVHCQVVIVGDSNQLPSVGAGNILKDLIDCNLLNVVTLTEIFRQAQESAIIMNAHRIIRGEYPDILVKDSDFFFLQRLKVDEAISTILDLWKSRLPKAYGYSSIDNIQVLTPSRKGALGTVSLNKLMQEVINPQVAGRTELKNENYTFRQGDKVMQIRNNYDIEWKKDGVEGKGIYNGDIGIITFISRQSIEIDFDGRVVTYNSDILDQLELAYAITIHKSQGSEFDVVIMPMLQNFKMLSYRNLLYTGVTRAKKLLVMVGSVKELENMVNNDRKVLRNSCLKDMIEFEYKEH
jgi:exodeoxyribonuclease V alpha subunit